MEIRRAGSRKPIGKAAKSIVHSYFVEPKEVSRLTQHNRSDAMISC